MAGLSPRQQSLDVVQLHKVLLEGVLKLSEESIRNQQNLSYLRDASEAMGLVRREVADIAFLMNPCPVQKVRDIAFAGEVMEGLKIPALREQIETNFFTALARDVALQPLS
jgi:uncharacterized protein (DUF1015 family)